MIISSMNINPKVQSDLIIYINGQNMDIDQDEENKLIDLLTQYYAYDVTFILEKCNNSYFSSISDILCSLPTNSHIVFEPNENELNKDFFELLNKLNCNIELSVSSENGYNTSSKSLNKDYSLLINPDLALKYYDEIHNNPYIKHVIISVDDITKINEEQLEKLSSLKKIIGMEFRWDNIKRKTF